MPRVAVIDIGTNSIKMIVAERAPSGEILVVAQDRAITRLGEGLAASGQIAPDAMERALSALARLADQARSAAPERIAAIGTAALREAANGQEFIVKAKERAGVTVEIISGAREAALAYNSVRRDPTLRVSHDKPLLVFDIGGGSTELVCGTGHSITACASLPIGAVRLTERYFISDPPADREYHAACLQAEEVIGSLHSCREPSVHVAGVGGTATNAASVAMGGAGGIHGSEITRLQVEDVARLLCSMPLAERRRVPGLEPARADIILGGMAILSALMASFQADSFTVSVRGIRYGLLWELLSADAFPPRPELGDRG